ncbi:MAG: hypothetical protein JSV62_01570 [Promethearchaeota archaeon]|nr:MAG: hypothetical protein JSV62_01570 [Candidatus Lokiarchaeota archaeon]
MSNEDIMKVLAALGAIISLIELILGYDERNLDSSRVILLVISILLATFILLTIITPHKFIGVNWLICVVFGIIMIVYTSLIGGILVLIAGFAGYAERP